MNCSVCKKPMTNVSGLGQGGQYECANMACPSHYAHEKCETCGESPAAVNVLGIGNQEFSCKNRHSWSSL